MPSEYYTLDGVLIEDKNLDYADLNFSGMHLMTDTNTKFYRLNGKRHRLGGPAIERESGPLSSSWWVYGEHVTKLEHDLLYLTMKLKGLL